MLLLGGLTALMSCESDGIVVMYTVLAAVFAFGATLRSVDDDYASGTLEQLDVLPMPRWRMALETAAGTLVAFGWFAGFGMIVGSLGARNSFDFGCLFVMLPLPVGAALLGTLPPLRHGMRRFVFLPYAAGLLYCWVSAMDWSVKHATNDVHAAALQLPVKLAALVAIWAVLWKIGHLMGGGWSGGEAPFAQRADPAGSTPRATMRLVPDGWNPLFWREVRLSRNFLAFCFVLGLLYIFSGYNASYRHNGPFNNAIVCMLCLIPGACMLSAGRTSADRLSGMWGDLAHTPISQSSVVWCRVRGMMTQVVLMALGWAAVGAMLGSTGIGDRGEALTSTLTGFCMLLAAILGGFCSGLSGRGIVAGFGGLILIYFMLMVSFIPSWLAGFVWPSGHKSAIFMGFSVIAGTLVYYGTLIYFAIRGVKRTSEEQRA